MSSCWFLISLLLVLLAHSLAQTPTESSSDSIHDAPVNDGSNGAEQREPENSCSKSVCHPINNNIQFYGHGDPSSTAATDKLLNQTGTILDILQNPESRCTPRPAPIVDPSSSAATEELLNQTGTILDILQTQAARYIFRPALSNVSGNPRDCAEIQASGQNTSGIYPVYPDGDGDPFFVWCDMETDGGGWTVFQRRQDGSVDFFLEWAAYKCGFGSVSSEHWLGNDNIHRLTIHKVNELRVDLEDFEGQTRYARYSTFFMLDEDAKYTMTTGDYSGDAGDSLSYHSGYQFSTKDSDNDEYGSHCATSYKGAWWYKNCYRSNLNALYLQGEGTTHGVSWGDWLGNNYSLKKTEMKIRPV